MNPFFYSIKKQEQLATELAEWLGTPWRHRCSVKKRGCDCIGFVIGVLTDIGALEFNKSTIPDYQQDWHMHKKNELLIKSLREQNGLQEFHSLPINGDILVFKYGKTNAHVGIYMNNNIYHSVNNRAVIRTPFRDPNFMKYMTAIFRCMDRKVNG